MAQGALSAGATELSTPCEESFAGSTPVCVTRICGSCGLDRPEDFFNFKTKGKRQGYCRECSRLYSRNYYRDNKERFSADILARKKRMVAENKASLNDIKSSLGCAACGEREPCCLDFHHLESDSKEFSIASGRHYCLDRLLREVAKCAVLCSNCHRKLHFGVDLKVELTAIGLSTVGACSSTSGLGPEGSGCNSSPVD